MSCDKLDFLNSFYKMAQGISVLNNVVTVSANKNQEIYVCKISLCPIAGVPLAALVLIVNVLNLYLTNQPKK